MPTTVYDVLRRLCGLSQQAAADFHDTRPDTVISWCSDRRPAPQGAIDELRDLYAQIRKAADSLSAFLRDNVQIDDDGRRFFRVGLPHDEQDARVCGFPSMASCEAAVAIAIASLPAEVPVKLVPRIRGAIPTAVIQNWQRRRTAPKSQKLTKEMGAKFSATLQLVDEGAQGSWRTTLDKGDSTFVQNDIRLFSNERDARGWLGDEARDRGFKTFPVETRDERSRNIPQRQVTDQPRRR